MNPIMHRVHDQKLSLWQSVVAEHVQTKYFAATDAIENKYNVMEHDLVKATDVFVHNRFNKLEDNLRTASLSQNASSKEVLAHLSELSYEIAWAKIENREEDVKALEAQFRPYSDADKVKFAGCAVTYVEYYALYGGKFKYNDWKTEGNGNINYGLIDYKLPNDAKVGIIGDWGTGLPDAYALLLDMVVEKQVDAIIHLGDIYYSGTPTECDTHYAAVFDKVWKKTGKKLPVFTIPGNHDYYALGYGYYKTITAMNNGIAGATQPASYFCLRTEDDGWQFLGMDTGYYDSSPSNQLNPKYAGPWLTENELLWHLHKLNTFEGSTVLLSHHQLFSANSAIDGMLTKFAKTPYLNPFLLNSFKSFFGNKIAAWLWGHEHNSVIYKDGIFGLNKGRLIGASAYEEEVSSDPYKVNYPQVPYLDPQKYRVSAKNGYFNHSYAVIDLGLRDAPTDAVEISYYEFPSWYGTAPPNPKSKRIYYEKVFKPSGNKRKQVLNDSQVFLKLNSGMDFIGPLYSGAEYYPTLSEINAAGLKLKNSKPLGSPLLHNDIIFIQTTETKAGKYNYLGAWSNHYLYYYYLAGEHVYNGQLWQIVKETPSDDPNIYYGDAVSFINIHYNDAWIAPTLDGYLTTLKKQDRGYFIIEESY